MISAQIKLLFALYLLAAIASSGSKEGEKQDQIPGSMDDPRDIEVPSSEEVQAMIAKNKENWFDDGNSPLFPGNSRKYVKINACPFAAKNPRGGESCKTCSKQSFSGAALWSTKIEFS